MFYIYKLTNTINGKIYIGKTNNPKRRLIQHKSLSNKNNGYYIHNAISKYGISNFNFDILYETDLEEDCLEKEMFYIDLFKTNINKYGKDFGYNLTDGGEGVSGIVRQPMSEEQKERISKALKGKYIGENSATFGKHLSQEHKDKISKAITGIIRSEMTKQKISEGRLGEKHWLYNKPQSVETREKIAKSLKGKRKKVEITQEMMEFFVNNGKNTDFTPIDNDIRTSIISLYDSGMFTHRDISEKLNIKINTVRVVLKKKNRQLFPNRVPEDHKNIIMELRKQGFTYKQIVEKTNLSYSRVEYIIRLLK